MIPGIKRAVKNPGWRPLLWNWGAGKNSGLTIPEGYIILSAYIGICEDGKQYPVCESQERTRLVEAFVQRPAKSSRSIGLNGE